MEKLVIKVPVYQFKCTVVIDDDICDNINKLFKKLKFTDRLEKNSVYGYAMNGKDVHDYYIFYDTKSVTPNTIAHEISHVVDFVFQDRGGDDNGEPRAYLIGHLSEKIFDFVLKKNLLISKWLNKSENQK